MAAIALNHETVPYSYWWPDSEAESKYSVLSRNRFDQDAIHEILLIY